jgi:hypothetical protein
MKRLAKIAVVLLLVMTFATPNLYGWDSGGHAAIGHIADRNLTPKARKMCAKYLGHSLAYYASWMDQVRYVDAYHHTARWHSVGVKDGELMPSDLTGSTAFYGTEMKSDDHGVAHVERIIEEMKGYKSLADSVVAVNLKLMIHLVGDLHCPGHTFFAEQSMQYYIKDKGKRIHYHNYFDAVYNRFNKGVSPIEFYDENCRLSKVEMAALCSGNIESWVRENFALYKECYRLLPKDRDYSTLSDEEQRRVREISNRLHIEAGYRLAHIINEMFK